jgi:hypothetical protein
LNYRGVNGDVSIITGGKNFVNEMGVCRSRPRCYLVASAVGPPDRFSGSACVCARSQAHVILLVPVHVNVIAFTAAPALIKLPPGCWSAVWIGLALSHAHVPVRGWFVAVASSQTGVPVASRYRSAFSAEPVGTTRAVTLALVVLDDPLDASRASSSLAVSTLRVEVRLPLISACAVPVVVNPGTISARRHDCTGVKHLIVVRHGSILFAVAFFPRGIEDATITLWLRLA